MVVNLLDVGYVCASYGIVYVTIQSSSSSSSLLQLLFGQLRALLSVKLTQRSFLAFPSVTLTELDSSKICVPLNTRYDVMHSPFWKGVIELVGMDYQVESVPITPE